MWPLSRPRQPECLRIGRLAVERWVGAGAGLSRVAGVPLPPDALSQPGCLVPSIQRLYAEKPARRVNVVLESAWLPLLLADTGGLLWREADAAALARHRLRMLYGHSGDDLATWDVRVDWRAGDRFALGYGLASSTREALLGACQQAGIEAETLVPALSWGWRRLRSTRQVSARTGWWVWPEQDRALVACMEAGRPVVLSAAAPGLDAPPDVRRIVGLEGARWGVGVQQQPIVVATWQPPERLPVFSDHVTWVSLAEAEPLSSKVTA